MALVLPEGFEINTYAEPFEVDYPTALTAAGDGTVYVSVDHNGSLGKLPEMGKVMACRDTVEDGKRVAELDSKEVARIAMSKRSLSWVGGQQVHAGLPHRIGS